MNPVKARSKLTATRQLLLIVFAILGMGIVLAVAIGLSLGVRPSGRIPPKKQADEKPVKSKPTQAMNDTGFRPSVKSDFGKYRMAAIQSDNKICSEIGMDIMVRKGGSAVDSAIATLFCIGVTTFQSAGIGGGHFMTVYDREKGSPNKTVKTFLAREVFPLAGYTDYYKNHSSRIGGTAVGVPGTIHGLYTAWLQYGRVPWPLLVYPSIQLCEGGFSIQRNLAHAIKKMKDQEVVTKNPNLRKVILNPDGSPKKEGDIIKRPKLAKTLRTIADDPMSFYNGSLAKDIVADIQEAGGIITEEDLIMYKTRERKPIRGKLKSLNLTMYGPEPPSSGVVVQFILRLLDGFGFNNSSLRDTQTAIKAYHKLIESFKFGFGGRAALADPLFWNVSQVVRNLTDDDYIDSIRRRIDLNETQAPNYYTHNSDVVEDAGTTHLGVLAPDGSAVSMTATINYYFGSGVYGNRTGILFNNEMDDFSIPGEKNTYGIAASLSNLPEPGKMPMSSMSPSIFLTPDDQVAYLLGAHGGPRIITAMINVALHNLYFKMDLGAATNHPRLHHQLVKNQIVYEPGFDEDVLRGLEALKHNLTMEKDLGYAGCVANTCLLCSKPGGYGKNCIHAVSDGREGGGTYGY